MIVCKMYCDSLHVWLWPLQLTDLGRFKKKNSFSVLAQLQYAFTNVWIHIRKGVKIIIIHSNAIQRFVLCFSTTASHFIWIEDTARNCHNKILWNENKKRKVHKLLSRSDFDFFIIRFSFIEVAKPLSEIQQSKLNSK